MRKKILKIRDEHLGNVSQNSSLQIPYFVFTIALIVTTFITYFYYTSAKTNDVNRFSNDVIKIQSTIESELNTYIALLRAGRGFFRSVENVDRKKFNEFIENIDLPGNYPSVQAIGYSKVFTAQEKSALEEQMKKEGLTEFTYKSFAPQIETSEQKYQSIIYIEPFDEQNKRALGYDMSSEAIRKEALEIARDTGLFATTGRVVLIQEDTVSPEPGFLIYFPIYKNHINPANIEERQKSIDGFIYAPFRAGRFINDVIAKSNSKEISFKIYDNEINDNNLLAIGNRNEKILDSNLEVIKEVDRGGRRWLIVYNPSETFKAQSLTWWTPIIFLIGLIASTILFFLSLAQSRANMRLVKVADELKDSQEEVQQLFESEQTARSIAEKSNKVKDDFISIVSHELRTPLNAISGWVQVLKADSLSQEIKTKAIETINKNLRSQVNLVDDMIDFSDSNFLKNHDKWQKVSFQSLLDNCLNDINSKVSQKNLNFDKEIAEGDYTIFCDKEKIQKVIAYLLDNAVKFTSEGGQISVGLNLNKENLEFRVKDKGEGIDPKILPNIFNLFNQTDISTTRKHGGLGVGLAIVKKIIEGHNGTIKAESEGIGEGSTFMINLPISKN